MFDNNFGKLAPFSKFFHQLIRKKIICVYMTDFRLTCTVLLHYLVKFENLKMLPSFTLNVTINMFN